MKKKKKIRRVDEIMECPETDPDGSYTGVVTSWGDDEPVQDADDL